MKMCFGLPMRRWIGALAVAVSLLLFSGCLEERVVWSPDGSRAAVLGKDGSLRLCRPDGTLSAQLATDVRRVAWLNADQLVLSRQRSESAWDRLAPLIENDRAEIEAQAEQAKRALLAGKPWNEVGDNLGDHATLVKICLRDRYGPEVQKRMKAEEWNEVEHKTATLSEIATARVTDDALTPGPVIATVYGDVSSVRVSPGGRALAWSAGNDKGDDGRLYVRSLVADTALLEVSDHAGAYPDWSADGVSLVYVERLPTSGPANDGMSLCVLVQRRVLNEQGKPALQEDPTYLATGLFSVFQHVRCLRDGRILFSAAELTLPVARADLDGEHREQLYVVDPGRSATLTRLIPLGRQAELPQVISFFDVSPDGRQVVFGGMKSEVVVLTLATGEVKVLQEAEKNTFQGLPSWRRDGELCYVRRMPQKEGQRPSRPAEIVLRSGDKEVVLSQSWPDDVLAKVADEDRR